jgi:lipopolysaccharide biosynthesis glycosyltransferase
MLLAKDLLLFISLKRPFIKIRQVLYKALTMSYKILILVMLLNPTKIKLIKSKIRGYKSFILLEKG